jgi:hypothetical protein
MGFINSKGKIAAGSDDRLKEDGDVIDEQRLPSVEQIDRKEPAPTRKKCAAEIGHSSS